MKEKMVRSKYLTCNTSPITELLVVREYWHGNHLYLARVYKKDLLRRHIRSVISRVKPLLLHNEKCMLYKSKIPKIILISITCAFFFLWWYIMLISGNALFTVKIPWTYHHIRSLIYAEVTWSTTLCEI